MSDARRVAVVTDSTAYLPEGVAEKYDVTVVPLHVHLGQRSGAEGREVHPGDVAGALAERHTSVRTSRPSPAEVAAAYRAAVDAGAEAIVSIHLSGRLSGTVDSAHIAVADTGLPVWVVDSRSTAMGLGFAVIAAAEASAADASPEEVARAATEAAQRTAVLFYVDTLEHLRRGGRIGAAAARFGTALAVKPLLHVEGGEIRPLERVRTASRAVSRLEDLAVRFAGDAPADVAVHHLAAPDRAALLADSLRARVTGLQSLYVSEVGAVVGAHVGPGLLGVVVHRW